MTRVVDRLVDPGVHGGRDPARAESAVTISEAGASRPTEPMSSTGSDVVRGATAGPPPAGLGPLGLEGPHRDLADLIRRGERLGCGGDPTVVRDVARRFVARLTRHVAEECGEFERIDPPLRRHLEHGQRVLVARARAYASAPSPDSGADLLALLVRQADAERVALEHPPLAPHRRSVAVDFVTDWALPTAPGAGEVGTDRSRTAADWHAASAGAFPTVAGCSPSAHDPSGDGHVDVRDDEIKGLSGRLVG